MARNTLSNLAKRDIAFSGRADIGDAPDLYAARAAMERARQAEMGGTPGLASGTGGVAPLPGGTSGGITASTPDVGLPGAGFENPTIERLYTQAYRRGGEGEMRGALADRGALNVDPADPFGLGFGEALGDVTQVAALLGIPGMGIANAFVNLMMRDAQARSDDFFEGLIFGTAPIDPTTGAVIDRDGPDGSGIGASVGGPGIGVNPDGTFSQTDPDPFNFTDGGRNENVIEGGFSDDTLGADISGDTFGGGGDAGSGSGGGSSGGSSGGQSDAGGSGGGVCFAGGTAVLMGDGNTTKPIETIVLGDKVMGFNEGNIPEPCEVIGCFAHRDKPVWRLNGSTLVTPGHRFYALIDDKGYGFWPLEEIPHGAKIMLADGSSKTVETIEDAGEHRDVFNITVQGLHTYIANGYRVHNIKHMGGYIAESRVPGKRRGDVDEVLQEGEFVLTADAVDMAGGPAYFDGMNAMARLMKGRK